MQSFICASQDVHFSQAFNSPLLLNPAEAGNTEGKFRFNSNYKDQWRSISKPYKTIYTSLDYVAFKKKNPGSYLGIGLSFYNDKAGTSNLMTTEANLMFSYNVKMNKNNFLVAGIGVGAAQKSINLNGLKWDNQFNGKEYNSSALTGEVIYSQKASYMDFSTGLLWNTIIDKKNRFSIGASIFHLNKPNSAFLMLIKTN